jgi:hypothetical protein
MRDKEMDPRSRRKLDKEVDNSLRGGALQRALGQKPPRTLTPYEWQHWYAENGIPKEHLRTESWLSHRWCRVKEWWESARERENGT